MESIENYNVLKIKKIGYDKEKEISDKEDEMYYLLEENRQMNDIMIKAERAKGKLCANRTRIIELAKEIEKLKEGEE